MRDVLGIIKPYRSKSKADKGEYARLLGGGKGIHYERGTSNCLSPITLGLPSGCLICAISLIYGSALCSLGCCAASPSCSQRSKILELSLW